MASFSADFGTKLKICPYNSAHKVSSSKFQSHVSKCGKSCSSGAPLRLCPYNATHVIPKDDYEHHLSDCCDGLQTMRNIYENKAHIKRERPDSELKVDDKKWKSEDIWSDEYEKLENTSSGQGFDVLVRDELTAEELFEMNVRSKRNNKGLTDSLYLSRMSNEERRKYYNLVVQEMRQQTHPKDAYSITMTNPNPNSNPNTNTTVTPTVLSDSKHAKHEINSNAIKAKVIDNNNYQSNHSSVFRVPVIHPFARNGDQDRNQVTNKTLGIGRGNNFSYYKNK